MVPRPLALCAALVLAVAITVTQAHFCGDANCFDILNVKRGATKQEIRRSYRKLSQTMHPDKRPGVKDAVADFRAIGTAYETLTDDEKRTQYEDFLDNPGKYMHLIPPKEYYAPKSNAAFVVLCLMGVITLVHWLSMNRSYKVTQERMRESVEFKREVSRLVKTKAAATEEEAAEMINLEIVGLVEPHWRDLVIVKLAYLPVRAVAYAIWSAKWMFAYKIRKLEFSEADKMYLIQKNLEMNDKEWDVLSTDDKKTFVEKELWDVDTCAEYKRLRRIEMNKSGKYKKKKRHTPMPYSEVEDVIMS